MKGLLTLLIATFVFTSSTSYAQHNLGPDPEEDTIKEARFHCIQAKKLVKSLGRDLSELQEHALAQALDRYRSQILEMLPNIQSKRKALFLAIHHPSLNTNKETVRSAYQQLADLGEEIAVRQAALMATLYPGILDAAEYRDLVALRGHADICLTGPHRRVREWINQWIDRRLP